MILNLVINQNQDQIEVLDLKFDSLCNIRLRYLFFNLI